MNISAKKANTAIDLFNSGGGVYMRCGKDTFLGQDIQLKFNKIY